MFKSLQVLRTAVAVTSVNGTSIPTGTRIVVVNFDSRSDTIVARVQDPAQPLLAKLRVHVTSPMVESTHRGRPTKETV